MINQYILEKIKIQAKKILYPVPLNLKRRQILPNKSDLQELEESLKKNYYDDWQKISLEFNDWFASDLEAHLHERLDDDRIKVIPWLNHYKPLKNLRILEIGCGTGSSTVALAEQGALVTGIDIDEGGVAVAKDRCRIYGLDVNLRVMNADSINEVFSAGAFDMIIFFACLEHMTITERLRALSDAWQILPSSGILAIAETPNRLWFFDSHTSLLPFFHWLPDELALQYSRYSSKPMLKNAFSNSEEHKRNMESFLRMGRGMSFHELDVAIELSQNLDVISSLSSFLGFRYYLAQSRCKRKYKSILTKKLPEYHTGFFDEYLYLMIKKK